LIGIGVKSRGAWIFFVDVQYLISDDLFLLREHAVRAPMNEARQTTLEIVLIAWRSASAL
jgi:hypothetical protein